MTAGQDRNLLILEDEIVKAKRDVLRMKALERISSNPDWKYLVDTFLFEEEPIRLVMLKCCEHAMEHEDFRKKVELEMDSIGVLKAKLNAVWTNGRKAEENLPKLLDTEDQIREEILNPPSLFEGVPNVV